MSSGVYRIRNIISQKCYIGSTEVDFDHRFCQHRNALRGGYHYNQYLQNAWKKYTEAAFVFEVLHKCPVDQCLSLEQAYLDQEQPEYNILPTAGNNSGYRHTIATKRKISLSMMGEQNHMMGRKHSDETRRKMSLAQRASPPKRYTKLRPDEVLEIRQLAEDGINYSVIAKRFGIVRSTITKIKKRQLWADLEA